MVESKPEKKLSIRTKSAFTAKDIGFIALCTAACVVGRTAFLSIPNVQPMTAIFIIIALRKGFVPGFIISILSVVVTNLYLGMGVWTISQLISYGVVLLIAFLLSKIPIFRKNIVLQTIFAGLAGFIFGFVIACVEAQIYGVRAFLPYYLQGVSFDMLHAAGNVIFYLILAPIMTKLFQKFWT